MIFYLDPQLEQYFSHRDCYFDEVMKLSGERFREQKGRITERICLGGRYYFIKKHWGIGVKEIFKNILQCRMPIISAKNEWLALKRLGALSLHVPRVFGYGERGIHPAYRQSFVLMEEVTHTQSLEELALHWQQKPPTFRYKNAILAQVAHIARTLHQHGVNHRDFYICHFLLDTKTHLPLKLFLIDLHRAQIRQQTPSRWRIKDLAGLYFSSKAVRLTVRDYLRFIALYRGMPFRNVLAQEKKFWQKVITRGNKLYRKHEALFKTESL